MARALAEEVHLDERYVAEHLRDAMAGGWVGGSLNECICIYVCIGLVCVCAGEQQQRVVVVI